VVFRGFTGPACYIAVSVISILKLRLSMSEAVRKHKEYLFPAVSLYFKEPIALVKGRG
jgi:hypothetical protein